MRYDHSEYSFGRWRRRLVRHWPLVSRLAVVVGAFVLVAGGVALLPRGLQSLKVLLTLPSVLVSYVAPTQPHVKATTGRTNVLLLGIAGGMHEGGLLSDTIIVASIDREAPDVVFFSLPRDVWVADLNSGAKINAAYAYGELKRKGGGLTLAKSTVSEVLGIPIHYAVRVDFAGFERAIDELRGIVVTVEQTFDDYRYPIAGKENDLCDGDETYSCRYEHIHFDAGTYTMNGKEALRFVRSRMASGTEGSDFARSKRQQKVIAAFKERVLSAETLLNPSRILNVLGAFGDSVDTDIRTEEIDDLAKVAREVGKAPIRSFVLGSNGQESLLVNPPIDTYGGAWVLVPMDPGWDVIHTWVREILADLSRLPPKEASPAAY